MSSQDSFCECPERLAVLADHVIHIRSVRKHRVFFRGHQSSLKEKCECLSRYPARLSSWGGVTADEMWGCSEFPSSEQLKRLARLEGCITSALVI